MATNPLLELAGSPGSGTSQFAAGNFGPQAGQRPAGQPRLSAAQQVALARLAAILAARRGGGGGSLQKLFLP